MLVLSKDEEGEESVNRVYYDEAKAREYFLAGSPTQDLTATLGGGSSPEFTQEIVSANPWYRVEYGVENEVDVAYCNGVFTYDGNNNLTVSWAENGNTESVTVSYAITDGKVVVPHDGKTETETLLTFENSVITTDSATVEGGSTYSGNVKWFKNQVDAEAFRGLENQESNSKEGYLLILTRKLGESITIGDDIQVTVLGVKGNQVRIGTDAPPETNIVREEIVGKPRKEEPHE